MSRPLIDETIIFKRTQLANAYVLQDRKRRQLRRDGLQSEFAESGDRMCWICGEDIGIVAYNLKDLCLECAEETLRYVLLPLIDPSFRDVDLAVEEMIDQTEREGSHSSPVHSPLMPRENSGSALAWCCWKCNTPHSSGFQEVCDKCGTTRPLEPLCIRCGLDIRRHKQCPVTRVAHEKWKCTGCSSDNVEEAVECRACLRARTWFCGACSLENPWNHPSCDACRGENRMSSLSTMVNREFLSNIGMPSEALRMQQEQLQRVEAIQGNTQRLEQRVDAIGLHLLPIHDDGNCLFRALSFQLVRVDVFYPVIRHAIVDFMEAHRAEYSLLIGGDEFDGYVSGMRQNTVWGDELCVHAAARAFGIKIHVVTSDPQRWHLKYQRDVSSPVGAGTSRRVFLCYRRPDHYYCAVHPTSDPEIRTIDLEACFKAWNTVTPLAGTPQGTTPPAPLPSSTSSRSSSTVPSAPPTTRPPPLSQQVQFTPQQQALLASLQLLPAGPVKQSPSALSYQPPAVFTLRQNMSEPPLLKRGGEQSATSLPSASQSHSTQSNGAKSPQREEPTTTAESRSMRNEVLSFDLFHVLQHPIMVTLHVAETKLSVRVSSSATLEQHQEGTYFYMYPIKYDMILQGPPDRYPWGVIQGQARQQLTEAKARGKRPAPLFLLQHIQHGGFVCPGDEITLKHIFTDYEPVKCTEAYCRQTTFLSNCLLTIDEHSSESKTRVYLKFFNRDILCPFVGLIGNRALFCCSLPINKSTFAFHQLFAGAPERLCLRCKQWYNAADKLWHAGKGSPGGCDHFSHVDEALEHIEPC